MHSKVHVTLPSNNSKKNRGPRVQIKKTPYPTIYRETKKIILQKHHKNEEAEQTPI
jgi:hypothetical protein